MNILSFESIGGASGDMMLGALLDLDIDQKVWREQLGTLDCGQFEIISTAHTHGDTTGNRVTVKIPAEPQPHRHLADILDIIEQSALPAPARLAASIVFRTLADAEAFVHETSPSHVHFHEVGAVDAIVDICGACLAIDMLEVTDIAVGPLPLGTGTVECQHGTIAVPVPASVKLLEKHPTTQTSVPFEMVTPTGAALLTALKTLDAAPIGTTIFKTGYGFGCRELADRPNVLKAQLLQLSR